MSHQSIASRFLPARTQGSRRSRKLELSSSFENGCGTPRWRRPVVAPLGVSAERRARGPNAILEKTAGIARRSFRLELGLPRGPFRVGGGGRGRGARVWGSLELRPEQGLDLRRPLDVRCLGSSVGSSSSSGSSLRPRPELDLKPRFERLASGSGVVLARAGIELGSRARARLEGRSWLPNYAGAFRTAHERQSPSGPPTNNKAHGFSLSLPPGRSVSPRLRQSDGNDDSYGQSSHGQSSFESGYVIRHHPTPCPPPPWEEEGASPSPPPSARPLALVPWRPVCAPATRIRRCPCWRPRSPLLISARPSPSGSPRPHPFALRDGSSTSFEKRRADNLRSRWR